MSDVISIVYTRTTRFVTRHRQTWHSARTLAFDGLNTLVHSSRDGSRVTSRETRPSSPLCALTRHTHRRHTLESERRTAKPLPSDD